MNQIHETDNFEFVRQVYRASSPTVTRQENRIKELEELLDLERESRKRLERSNMDLDEQLENVTNQVDECSISSSQYNDAIRRRDADIGRLRKELEKLALHMEASEQDLRKKNHSTIMEMKNEIESLQKQRLKCERDKVILVKELESTLVHLDASTKLKTTLEARMENAESQLTRTKGLVDELERQIKDLSSHKTMLFEENANQKTTIKDVTHQNNLLRKSKSSLELQLDESRKIADDEIRVRENLQFQNHQLSGDNEQLKVQLEDEMECHHRLQQQLAKINGDVCQLKSKYDKDVSEKSTEFEELRRKSIARINELTEEASREHLKVTSLEKSRQQLAMENADLNGELERVEVELESLHSNVKSLENANNEMANQIQELSIEITTLRMTNAKVSSENSRLKMNLEEEEHKNCSLAKDNTALSGQLRDERDILHSVSKELAEVQSIRSQLESERLNLFSALEETKEMLLDSERKYQATHSSLLQLRTDMEQRLVEKNGELDSLRKNSQRTIEDLSASLTELETKYKTEVAKLKKKYELQSKQLQDNLDAVQKENGELSEELQETCAKLQEVETLFEEEKHELQLVQEKLSSSERRRVQLQGDLEDSNRLLEAADKSRKHIQLEIEEISMKSADCASHINSLSNDKRKLENEIAALKADMEDVSIGKQESEERAFKLSNETNVLMDELKQEQDVNRKSEVVRKNLALELKETRTRLEQRESLAVKDLAKNNQTYQERIRELESELESECARSKDAQMSVRKQDRLMKELQQEAADERQSANELRRLFEAAQTKLKANKKELEELEAVNAENVSRYRRAQKQMDDFSIGDRRSIGLNNAYLSSVNHAVGSAMTISSYSRNGGKR